MALLGDYIASVLRLYQTGLATEVSLRQVLVDFLQSVDALQKFTIINEPKRIECGAPDIVLLQRDNVPVAYIETKDIGDTDLRGEKQNKEQFSRYKQGLNCVVFTDFLRFLLYEDGECLFDLELARQDGEQLRSFPEAEAQFLELLAHLHDAQAIPITSAKKLARHMASKTQLLARSVKTVLEDIDSEAGRELGVQLERMRQVLMSTVEPQEFADWYAQTLVYGLFAARYHDEHPDTFSRKDAAELIPKSNPFLRKLFQRIGVYDLDVRIAWIIDDLVGVFGATDVRTLLDANKAERDPVMLFYEDFLTAYDPARRKARGVYYTPAPVVEFMVRAVDELLQRDFGLRDGLADCSVVQNAKGQEVHRLQILDPATGTGTFLAEVVRKIHAKFEGQQGVWNEYVRQHLLPRLHGYEILMAPYAMAHLNLEYVFHATGATELGNARYGIYLTNTLEEQHADSGGLFPIDVEASAANALKRDMHVMVMLGNPPYNVSSSNKNAWIEALMADYKTDLNEKMIKALSDDYIKFIRFAQYQIEHTGEGVVAFITNNRFLDGLIHRRMRQEILRVFDAIYIVNLHGNSRLKEKTPDGGKDENVFNIQQGVSINIFVKRKEKNAKAPTVFYTELWGLRKEKEDALATLHLDAPYWKQLKPLEPNYFFVEKHVASNQKYYTGFSLSEIFAIYSVGAVAGRDKLISQCKKTETEQMLQNILSLDIETFRTISKIGPDSKNWKLQNVQNDLRRHKEELIITAIAYRPFDRRIAAYTGANAGIFLRPLYKTLGGLLHPSNFALCTTRQVVATSVYQHCFVCKEIVDFSFVSNRSSEGTMVFPLYKFPEGWDYTPAEIVAGTTKDGKPLDLELNMRPEILAKIAEAVGESVTGEEVFDYIYGVLHDKEYCAKFLEFLKIDYPRIPYPKDKAEYQYFLERGEQLRRLHLMDESLELSIATTFDVAGTNRVELVKYDGVCVWINDAQYFGNVEQAVWEHYVGSYQPARLWLQKRIGRTLNYEEIRWYQRIVATIQAELKLVSSAIDS